MTLKVDTLQNVVETSTVQVADIAKTSTLAASSGASLVGYGDTTVNDHLLSSGISLNSFAHLVVGSDWTAAINAASSVLFTMSGGGVVHIAPGTYNYTRLIIRSGVILQGAGSQTTNLVCIDPTTLDAGIAIGSSIRKPDDGARVYRAGFKGLCMSSGAAGTGANQAAYSSIAALNLCACERTMIDDVAFLGFGQGAIILARAENGAEGLGFINTSQDGNYNYAKNISIGSCGKYNTATSAIWFKYKANSNKFYGVFAKGMTDAYMAGIDRSNDNTFFGGTLESSKGVANIGFGAVAAAGNGFFGMRIESCTGDGYYFGALAETNIVVGGYHTGVTGLDFNLVNPNNRVIADNTNYLRIYQFPPASNYSTLHNMGALDVTSINGDPTYPLYIKSRNAGIVGNYPQVQLYNDIVAGAVGNILGRVCWSNKDSSTNAAGISAAVDAVLDSTSGHTDIVISTGTGTTLTEKFRVKSDGTVIQTLPTAATTLIVNNTMTATLTSDTNLRFSVRGSDGVTRVANLTLA